MKDQKSKVEWDAVYSTFVENAERQVNIIFSGGGEGNEDPESVPVVDLPAFGNAFEIARRILNLEAIPHGTQYAYLNNWTWCVAVLENCKILWQNYLAGCLDVLSEAPDWNSVLTQEFAAGSGSLIAHNLSLIAPSARSQYELWVPWSKSFYPGHIVVNLERFAVANSLVFEDLFIWSIVRDQLNSGFWLTRAGTRCKSGLAAATRFATARFTTGWVASVEVQASGILAADLHVDNVSIRLAQHSEDVQYLFDDYFLRYDPWSPQDRVTKIEKDILATRAIFEAAVEFVGRHALRSEIPTIDAIFLAEIASKERRSNLESLLSRIVGNYIPREMHEQGRSFIETVISQCGRRVLPQLFNGMKRTPAWSDLADPERWIGNNGTAARLGDI